MSGDTKEAAVDMELEQAGRYDAGSGIPQAFLKRWYLEARVLRFESGDTKEAADLELEQPGR